MIAKAKKQAKPDDGVVISDIGPIERLELEAKPGTITVLRGLNGQGKSTALEAIDAVTRGGGKLESRDGTVGGSVSGFGVTIKVGRGGANRRTGDLVVTSVEDRLSIADFVDPNIKDPCAADGKRLKALVALAGLEADPTLFEGLCETPEEFRELVKPEALKTSDPVEMASSVKRCFEEQARIQSTRAERLHGEIVAKLAANDGLDLTAEHDSAVLQKNLEMAIQERSTLTERLNAAGRNALARQRAEQSLKDAQAQYSGPSAAEAESRLAAARDEVAQHSRMVEEAQAKLRELQSDLASSVASEKLANAAFEAAKQHEYSIASWRQTIESTVSVNAPSEEVLAAAETTVEAARKASETGVLIRVALQRKQEAEDLEVKRSAAVKRAEALRDCAARTLEVLAEGVATLIPGLRIDEELRIVVPHKKRKECYFADLSHGERWKLAIDLAVAAFARKGQRGVLSIPQEAWESLDGPNRQLIAQHVSTKDLVVFTAEAYHTTDAKDGLDVEVLTGGAKS